MKSKIKLVTLFAVVALFSASSNASIIKVTYEGVVGDISTRLLGGPVNIGDALSGSYVVDTDQSVPNIQTWGSNNEWSQTFFEGALQDSFLNLGSESFHFFGGFVRTDPNTPGETAYSVYTRQGLVSATSPNINGLPVNSMSVNFSNFDQIFPLDDIPLTLPPFDPFTDPASMFLRFTNLGNDYIRGNLTSVSITTVSEPSALSLMLLSLLLLPSISIKVANKAIHTEKPVAARQFFR